MRITWKFQQTEKMKNPIQATTTSIMGENKESKSKENEHQYMWKPSNIRGKNHGASGSIPLCK